MGAASGQRHEEFVLLYARHQPAMFGYIFSLLPDWAEAEDVLQKTSLILWQKFDDFRPGTDFARWACTVARFTVLKRLRERARDRLVFDDEVLTLLAEEALDDLDRHAAERRALARCLEQVPADERAALEGYYERRATVEDLASRFGRTVAATYKRLSRLRAGLLGCIAKRLTEEGYP